MAKFLEIYNLPRLNHEELENLIRLVNSEKTETIKNLPKIKVRLSLVNSTKQSKNIWYLCFSNFQKTEEEATLPNTFYEANITLVPKPGKDNIKKQTTNISHEHRCRNPKQNIVKLQYSSAPEIVKPCTCIMTRKKCLSTRCLLTTCWHFPELVWATKLPHKRKCFILQYSSPSWVPEQINDEYK